MTYSSVLLSKGSNAMFFNFKKKKKQEQQEQKKVDDAFDYVEREARIEALKSESAKRAKNVTLATRKVNHILYEKTEDIVLNIFLATGGDRR